MDALHVSGNRVLGLNKMSALMNVMQKTAEDLVDAVNGTITLVDDLPTDDLAQYGNLCTLSHCIKDTIDKLDQVDEKLHQLRGKQRQQIVKRRFVRVEAVQKCPTAECPLSNMERRRKKPRNALETTHQCENGHVWHAHEAEDDGAFISSGPYQDGNPNCMLCCESTDDDQDMFP